MDAAIRQDILARLNADYAFKDTGAWLRQGKCPACGKKELYVGKEVPWTVKCGRIEKCGHEFTVKEAYPDLFDNWSDRYERTNEAPNAAADAYLRAGRGLNTARLSGAYTQEIYRDRASGETSATIRFPIAPYGDGQPGWWERIIDRPWRFGKKKANFPYGWSFRGQVWRDPKDSIETLSTCSEVWFAEGVFDAAALNQQFATERAKARAVASLTTQNYPAAFLADLARSLGSKRHLVTLVFAYDTGAAGTAAVRAHVKAARDEGWMVRAALPTADGEGDKQDWNDLVQAGLLTSKHIDHCLENGAITIAKTAREKAFLLWKRSKKSGFALTFAGRTFWAKINAGALSERMNQTAKEGESEIEKASRMESAVEQVIEVQEIANCTWRALYFERDLDLDESSYFLQVDFPGRQDRVKANFAGSALAAGAEFKKRLMSVGPGAIYTGDTTHLDAMMRTQLTGIKTVEALHFTGYSAEHGAWILGDLAVFKGRVLDRNAEDYFDIGKLGLKLRGASKLLTIYYTPDRKPEDRFSWWQDFYTAFGHRGLIAMAYWFASLYAEQIRAWQKSLGFLELTGEPGTGKSTLLMFLWKLLGRDDGYEGFDPAKATSAAIARNLARVANLPVVMIEGDRTQDQPHSKRFDWEELKSLYNGQSSRARGKANGGLETFEPKFRGSLVVGQNRPIEASPPVLERIIGLHFDKSGFTVQTKEAAERIERVDGSEVSGWIIEMTRHEAKVMETFKGAFAHHESQLLAHPEIRNYRLAKTHGQLSAALDCLAMLMPMITPHQVQAAHAAITRACVDRHALINADHPIVRQFWELFDHLEQDHLDKGLEGFNHACRSDTISINLVQFEQAVAKAMLRLPAPMLDLKKLLATSKSRKFLRQGTVTSRYEREGKSRSVHCWQFSDGITSPTINGGRS